MVNGSSLSKQKDIENKEDYAKLLYPIAQNFNISKFFFQTLSFASIFTKREKDNKDYKKKKKQKKDNDNISPVVTKHIWQGHSKINNYVINKLFKLQVFVV